MKSSTTAPVLALAACLVAFSAWPAEPRFTPAREVAVSELILPTSDPGLLTVTCQRCITKSYLSTLTTEYLIGEQRVTLAELRQHLLTLRQGQAVVLNIAPDQRHVVRVWAPGASQ